MKQTFIGMVGLQGSGKTTFVKKIIEKFPEINHVRGDALREFIISNTTYYSDTDYSYHNPKIDSLNKLMYPFRNALIKELLSLGESVILDAAGGTSKKRKQPLTEVKSIGREIQTILILIDTDEDIVHERLVKRDEGKNTKWVETAETFWKPNFEAPKTNEVDFVFVVNNNEEEILEQLEKILKKVRGHTSL